MQGNQRREVGVGHVADCDQQEPLRWQAELVAYAKVAVLADDHCGCFVRGASDLGITGSVAQFEGLDVGAFVAGCEERDAEPARDVCVEEES